MILDSSVNDQVTDAVTQGSLEIMGNSPAMAMGSSYQTMAHAFGVLFEGAVAGQHRQTLTAIASSSQGLTQVYSVNSMAGAGTTEQVSQTGMADALTSLRGAIEVLTPHILQKT